ncbi:MAG: archaellin/type IV pilin N-terminal domain-containing protein [Nanoarchaeota archaeon]
MNKKAISPLISTILLIVFAGSLGAVVISWGESTPELSIKKSCDDIGFEVVDINSLTQICYRNNELEFLVQNTGNVDISGFKLDIISDDISAAETGNILFMGDVIREKVPIYTNNIQKIIILPKITKNNIDKLCSDKGVGIEPIRKCD